MLSRRSFVLSLLGCGLVPSQAFAIGVFGPTDLWPSLSLFHTIDDGIGPEAFIFASPGCDKAGDMWETTQAYRHVLRFRWIPVIDGSQMNRPRVAACFSRNTTEAVFEMIRDEHEPDVVEEEFFHMVDAQERHYQKVARMLWEATGRTPAMPTTVFKTDGGRSKVIRGAYDATRFPEVLREARGIPI